MGNFYTNYTVRTDNHDAVVSALAGRSAYVTRAQDGFVLVFDEESDNQDTTVINALGARLSQECKSAVLAVLNHDDDILWYQLHVEGCAVDEYDSTPGYFDGDEEYPTPKGGDAELLCRVFANGNPVEVERILRKAGDDEEAFVFAVERHAELAGVLGLPAFSVGTGFRYVDEGELPEGLEKKDLIKVT
jgi:hypothetical protein